MKLSEERISSICDQAVDRLVARKVIRIAGPASKVRTELERVFIGDLKIEDDLRREATAFVRRMRNAPPAESAEFETLVRRQLETLANKQNYVL